jgi:NTP pyrophosphatase (non-canonical NTP hydrolase)
MEQLPLPLAACTQPYVCERKGYCAGACPDKIASILHRNTPTPEMQQELIKRTVSIDLLQKEIFQWAEATFPDRTDASMFLKIYGEVAELIDAGDDAEKCGKEIGDLIILLLDYAERKGVKTGTATLDKLEVNKQRTWAKTSVGNYRHVK